MALHLALEQLPCVCMIMIHRVFYMTATGKQMATDSFLIAWCTQTTPLLAAHMYHHHCAHSLYDILVCSHLTDLAIGITMAMFKSYVDVTQSPRSMHTCAFAVVKGQWWSANLTDGLLLNTLGGAVLQVCSLHPKCLTLCPDPAEPPFALPPAPLSAHSEAWPQGSEFTIASSGNLVT